jgi:hypothetical protein
MMEYFLKRLLCSMMLVGLVAGSAFAQEDPLSFGPDESAPDAIVPPDEAPTAEPDRIAVYQVRQVDSDYMAGRLQVVDSTTGEVRPVRKTSLLVVQGNTVVGRAETGNGGVAQIPKLPTGSYAVIAIGPDGLGAFGFEILESVTGVAVPSYRFDAMIVPSVDVSAAQAMIRESIAVPGAAPPAKAAPAAEVDRIPVATVDPVAMQDLIRRDASASMSSPLKGQSIVIRNGQSGVGRLYVLDTATGSPVGLANTKLSLLRGGREVSSAQTDSEGYCQIGGLSEGYYSIVGVGPNGFVAMGIRIEATAEDVTADAKQKAVEGQESVEYVSLLQPPPADWGAAGAPIDSIGYAPGFVVEETVVTEEVVPAGPYGAPFGGGGGGFGAGGGGGLGGGGLLGALVGAGVGAAIGAAIASDDDDDDDDNIPPIPPRPSPNQPPRRR